MTDLRQGDFHSLQQTCVSTFRKYNSVSTRTLDQVLALPNPLSIQNCLDIAKWQKQETTAHEAYTNAMAELMDYLMTGRP
jgi:hypothetical protein